MKLIKIVITSALFSITLAAAGHCGSQEYFDKGNAHFFQRQSTEALNDYQYVVKNYPHDPLAPECLIRIGTCYFEMNNLTESTASLEKIIDEYPNSEQAKHAYFLMGGNYLVVGDTESAINWFKQRVKRYPENILETWKAYVKLGLAYYLKGDFENALATYKKIMNDYPYYAVVTEHMIDWMLGNCYQSLDRYSEAIESYNVALISGTKGAVEKDVITFNVGECYEGKKDYTQAKIWYQKVIDNYPGAECAAEAARRLKKLKNK